jgi:hypothetical protein
LSRWYEICFDLTIIGQRLVDRNTIREIHEAAHVDDVIAQKGRTGSFDLLFFDPVIQLICVSPDFLRHALEWRNKADTHVDLFGARFYFWFADGGH